jgi:uncharacterized protein (TIGR03435 family)
VYRAVTILLISVSEMLRGQTAPSRFAVASIKPVQEVPDSSSGIRTGHGRLDAHNVTLKRCIIGAYGVGPHEIVGGPDWLETERFEISAKADQPIDDDEALMEMLKDLLAERFKLAIHRATKVMPTFVLEVAKKGPKMDRAEAGESGTNTTSTNTGITIEAHNTDMNAFARTLARRMTLPVVNNTKLDGMFNLKLQWTPDRFRLATDSAHEDFSIFTALQEQLGLHLRSRKAPVQVLIIDHAERPSPN